MRAEHVTNLIGSTPVLRLGPPIPDGVAVYAKLEAQNPFAMKDRVAKQIITEARHTGVLPEGAPIVESSSGTMALGVALVGTALGHPVHIITDPRIDRITMAKLEALGCVVHVVARMDERGWQGARLARLAEVMAANPGAFWPRQYENPDNPAAYRALADELTADLGDIDVLVGSVGSGGSLCGAARALRERLPRLRVVGVDCVGSVLFGQPDQPTRLQSGLGNSIHPRNLDRDLVDEVHWLNDREAFAATRALAEEQKLFYGNTSGSVYRVLTELAQTARPGTKVVGVFPDRGDRYVTTVYDDAFWSEHGIADLPLATRPRDVVAGATVRSWSRLRPDPSPVFAFVESNTTGSGMLALRTAARLGFVPLLLTSDPDRYAGLAETGSRVIRCDTDDPAALRAALLSAEPAHRIAGVTTTSEFALIAAARLAGAIGLPAERPDALAACRDKGRLRALLAEAGVRQPRFRVVATQEDAVAAAREVGWPCVVKPVDDSGSTRVRLCGDAAEVAAHAAEIIAIERNVRGQRAARTPLVEQYLDFPEYSVEMVGEDGEHRLLGVVEKTVVGVPHFVEAGHVVPADLPEETVERMVETVRAALAAAGVRRGPTHTEVKLTRDGAAIVEVNPRLAGGMIPELLRLATGVDPLEEQIRATACLAPGVPGPAMGCAGIRFLLAAEAGLLDRVEGVSAATRVPGIDRVVVTARPSARVRPPREAYDRLGYVIAAGADRAAVLAALDRACALITVAVRAPRLSMTSGEG